MSNITIQSRKTQQDLNDINAVANDAITRLGAVENELANNIGAKVNEILNDAYIRTTLDTFLASDDELTQALTDAIQARANLHDSVKQKYNRLVQVLYEGLDIQGIAQHELELGELNESSAPAFELVEGREYTIRHVFKLDKDGGFIANLQGMYDVDGIQWDWSQVASVSMLGSVPAGFSVGADGAVSFGDAFTSIGAIYTIAVVGVNGANALLHLEDTSPPPFEVVEGREYVIHHAFKSEKDAGQSSISLNNFFDADNNVWTWNNIASASARNGSPAGFSASADGTVIYGDAFTSPGEIQYVDVVGVNGASATLMLRDI